MERTVVLVNQTGEQLPLTKEEFELLQSGALDADLDRLTTPLEAGKVEEFEITADENAIATVQAEERPYFIHESKEVTTTKNNVTLEGELNSHSKSSNRGTFYTVGGKHIPYRYCGEDISPLLRGYAHRGFVRVRGTVKFDENMDPIGIDISEVELKQPPLGLN